MSNRILAVALMILFSFYAPGAGALEKKPDDPIRVFAGILPHSFFIKRIGGDHVDVKVMVLPGQNPANYTPGARQVAALSRAGVYFAAGVPFEEAFLHKIENTVKGIMVVDLTRGIELRKMAAGHHHDDDHAKPAHGGKAGADQGEDGHDAHGDTGDSGYDPHIWLSPVKALKQARIIYETLVSLNPALEPEFTAGYEALASEITALHRRIAKTLAPLKGRELFVFHPAYGYFADTYGMTQVAVEMEGKAPDARNLSRFIELAGKSGVRVVFVQPQFSPRSARTIARAIGGAVVSLDPLAENYLSNLARMALKIEKALGSD